MRGMGAMKGMQKTRFAQFASNARLLPIFDEELAAVWSTRSKTPKEALDDAVERGNKLLKTMVPAAAKPAARRR